MIDSTLELQSESGISAAQLQQMATFIKDTLVPALPEEVRDVLRTKRIVVLATHDVKVADGLFIPPDEGARDGTLEIRIRGSVASSADLHSLLAHEFFHAVHYLLHPGEEAWIREGLAQVFEYRVLGRFNGVNLAAGFKELTTPLMGEYSVKKIDSAQYGHNLLYFHYLGEQCGKWKTFWKIASGVSDRFGAEGIDRVLRDYSRELTSDTRTPQCESFEASAVHFEIARAHNRMHFDTPLNRKAHYLLGTSLSGPVPRLGISAEELRELPSFTPVLLNVEAAVSGDITRFWLQRKFPFAVRENPPVDRRGDWVQLVFKKSM